MINVPVDHRAVGAGHPDPIAFDRTVQVATATVLLEEGVEVGQQEARGLIAHTATVLG
jgi:hypothetical protein